MSDFGLVQWDSVEFYNRNSNNRKKDNFIKLQNGSNIIRIVTRPFQYSFHKWKEPGTKGWGDKINCSIYHGSCPLCTKGDRPKGDRPKRRWYIGIIDRTTQSYKILDMSPAVFQAVQKFTRQEAWGDPGNYDIDITVDKDAGANGYYTVMPLPKVPLSDNDVRIKKDEADVEALERRCTPPKPEEVDRRLRLIHEDKVKKGELPADTTNVAVAAEVMTPAAPSATPQNSSDDEEYDFPMANVSAS